MHVDGCIGRICSHYFLPLIHYHLLLLLHLINMIYDIYTISDKMRWVHIMKQGEYYETGLTALFHRILSMYDSTEEPPPLMLDIGMNIGWFSLYSKVRKMFEDILLRS